MCEEAFGRSNKICFQTIRWWFDGDLMGLDLDGMREWEGGERAALYSLPIAYSWVLFLRFAVFG